MFYVEMVMKINGRLIMLYIVAEERYINNYWKAVVKQKKHIVIRDG